MNLAINVFPFTGKEKVRIFETINLELPLLEQSVKGGIHVLIW